MGRLLYGDDKSSFNIDDAVLIPLRVVVANKLRRGEPFMLTVPLDAGAGHRSVWVSPSVPLVLHAYATRSVGVDRQVVEDLMSGANSPDGLDLRPFLRH